MSNLRRFSPQAATEQAAQIMEQLSARLLTRSALDELLHRFKFRDSHGESWTFGPLTRTWYRHQQGGWKPAGAPPKGDLDGPADLDLPASSRRVALSELPSETPAGEAAPDPAAYLKHAVERVAQSYAAGALDSDAAEAQLDNIYAVDARGNVWALGVQTGKWYTFGGDSWQPSSRPLDAEAFQGVGTTPSGARPKFCGNCGHALTPENKFCPNCGTPVPQAEAGAPAADTVEQVNRFLNWSGAQHPEPMVPAWTPPEDFPDPILTCPHCSALNVGDMGACVSCGKPLSGAAIKSTAAPRPEPAAPAKTTAAAVPESPVAPAKPAAGPQPPQAEPYTPAPSTPAPARRRSPLVWIVGIVGACILMACLAVVGVAAYRMLSPGSSAAPPPTAEVNVIPVQPGGPVLAPGVLLDDTFDDPIQTAVPLFKRGFMEFNVDAGVGTMTAHVPGALVAMYDSPTLADFDATLRMYIPSPQSGAGYGMVFRSDDAQGGLDYYYALLIMPAEGQAVLKRFDSAGVTDVATGSIPFDLPSEVNVEVRAQGSNIDIAVDGDPTISAQDDGILGPGIFGLLMNSPVDGDTVIFDEFTVSSPQ